MNLLKTLKNVAIAALLLSAGAANAAIYQFSLTGGYTASWQLNSTLTPDAFVLGEGFILTDVEGNFPGSFLDLADLSFFNATEGGGLGIDDFFGNQLLLSTDGPQLYSGPETSPTFLLGTFSLTEFGGTDMYTLTVTDLDAVPPVAVPEPASAALLIGGLALLAASRRRRQVK